MTTTATKTVTKNCERCQAGFSFDVPAGRMSSFLSNVRQLCSECADILSEEERVEQIRDAEAMKRNRADHLHGRRVEASHLPRNLRGLTIDAQASDATRAAAEWGAGLIDGLVLAGPVGTGKTYLAAAAAWARLQHQAVLWASVPTIVAKSFNPDDRPEVAAILTAGRKSLVLDDLDKVKPGDWVAAQLFSAIDSRIAEGSGLMITTNLKVSEIADRLGEQFGEAIASRLAGYCRIVTVHGRDRRLA